MKYKMQHKHKNPCKHRDQKRQTGLEPATPTLARSYSTNWATVAYKQMTGIEPASSAWEADILPMNYICTVPYNN